MIRVIRWHLAVAKQEAFEEKIKLRNQFRSLDEDEVEFLDSVMESTRAQEAAVKQDTAEQLEVFRRQREEAEKVLLEDNSADVGPPAEGGDWKIPARKRRRDKNKDLLVPGKKRKSLPEDDGGSVPQKEQKTTAPEPAGKAAPGSVAEGSKISQQKSDDRPANTGKPSQDTARAETKQPEKPTTSSLGLVAYGSDSDSE